MPLSDEWNSIGTACFGNNDLTYIRDVQIYDYVPASGALPPTPGGDDDIWPYLCSQSGYLADLDDAVDNKMKPYHYTAPLST